MNIKMLASKQNKGSSGFNSLPPKVQERIKYLVLIDFRAAKALYDQFSKEQF
ncbi:MAG: hypothetical protein JSR33_07600 [Proteobacteria bacterium]|nr:hypothetical protein [Pseudomonadota bacterium]